MAMDGVGGGGSESEVVVERLESHIVGGTRFVELSFYFYFDWFEEGLQWACSSGEPVVGAMAIWTWTWT